MTVEEQEKASDEDIKAGRVKKFKTKEELLSHLDGLGSPAQGKCEKCGGKGYTEQMFPRSGFAMKHECPSCHGTGRAVV